MKKIIHSALVAAVLSTSAMANDFPLSIEHRFGTTVIESQPVRIATVDYAGTDNILALGFQPITSRYWFGDDKNGVWPWAHFQRFQ